MFSTIVVPLDGSETAAQALPVATEMAKRFASRVHLIQIVDTGSASLALGANAAAGALTDPAAITGEVNEQVALANAYLTAVADQFAEQGVTADFTIEDGPPAEDIIAAAAGQGADLIVMCSHGRTGLRRLLHGSVAQDVMRNAPMPVLIVRAAGTVS